MVPSDYMAAQLASEDRLELLDKASILKDLGLNSTLEAMLQDYQFTMLNGTEKGNIRNLNQYAVPYF